MPKVLSDRMITRAKRMWAVTIFVAVLSYISSKYVVVSQETDKYDGPYNYDGKEYKLYQRMDGASGYIEEYSNKEAFCTSSLPLIVPGTSLLSDVTMGIVYTLVLFWFFLGIAIVADIFMESIEQITSKSEFVIIQDLDGKDVTVEKMFWNATIANLTLMALGSSAPEIILATAGVALDIEGVPSDLGPMSIVGSAAFNLLVISAVSIMAVPATETKKIEEYGVFLITCVFSVWAYIWFYLVLVIFSPSRVSLVEAGVTFGFMVILVILAYGADRWAARGHDAEAEKEAAKKKGAKTSLRILK